MGLGGGRRLAVGPETSCQEQHASCSCQARTGPRAPGKVSLGWEHAQLNYSQEGRAEDLGRGASTGVGACK